MNQHCRISADVARYPTCRLAPADGWHQVAVSQAPSSACRPCPTVLLASVKYNGDPVNGYPAEMVIPSVAFGNFEPPGLSATASTTIYFFTFAATLFGRPCGAVIFGHRADKIGRRRTTMISIAGFRRLHHSHWFPAGLCDFRCVVADTAYRITLHRRRSGVCVSDVLPLRA